MTERVVVVVDQNSLGHELDIDMFQSLVSVRHLFTGLTMAEKWPFPIPPTTTALSRQGAPVF